MLSGGLPAGGSRSLADGETLTLTRADLCLRPPFDATATSVGDCNKRCSGRAHAAVRLHSCRQKATLTKLQSGFPLEVLATGTGTGAHSSSASAAAPAVVQMVHAGQSVVLTDGGSFRLIQQGQEITFWTVSAAAAAHTRQQPAATTASTPLQHHLKDVPAAVEAAAAVPPPDKEAQRRPTGKKHLLQDKEGSPGAGCLKRARAAAVPAPAAKSAAAAGGGAGTAFGSAAAGADSHAAAAAVLVWFCPRCAHRGLSHAPVPSQCLDCPSCGVMRFLMGGSCGSCLVRLHPADSKEVAVLADRKGDPSGSDDHRLQRASRCKAALALSLDESKPPYADGHFGVNRVCLTRPPSAAEGEQLRANSAACEESGVEIVEEEARPPNALRFGELLEPKPNGKGAGAGAGGGGGAVLSELVGTTFQCDPCLVEAYIPPSSGVAVTILCEAVIPNSSGFIHAGVGGVDDSVGVSVGPLPARRRMGAAALLAALSGCPTCCQVPVVNPANPQHVLKPDEYAWAGEFKMPPLKGGGGGGGGGEEQQQEQQGRGCPQPERQQPHRYLLWSPKVGCKKTRGILHSKLMVAFFTTPCGSGGSGGGGGGGMKKQSLEWMRVIISSANMIDQHEFERNQYFVQDFELRNNGKQQEQEREKEAHVEETEEDAPTINRAVAAVAAAAAAAGGANCPALQHCSAVSHSPSSSSLFSLPDRHNDFRSYLMDFLSGMY